MKQAVLSFDTPPQVPRKTAERHYNLLVERAADWGINCLTSTFNSNAQGNQARFIFSNPFEEAKFKIAINADGTSLVSLSTGFTNATDRKNRWLDNVKSFCDALRIEHTRVDDPPKNMSTFWFYRLADLLTFEIAIKEGLFLGEQLDRQSPVFLKCNDLIDWSRVRAVRFGREEKLEVTKT